MHAPKPRLIHNLVHDVADQHDGEGEIRLKPALDALTRRHVRVADGREAGPELRDQDEDIEDEAGVGAVDGGLRLVRQLVERVALQLPGAPELDVAQADGGPVEDGGEARDGEHPVEGLRARVTARRDDVADEAKGGGEEDGDEGPARAVNVAEDFGRLAAVGERGERAGWAVDGGVADAEDGDHDDYVHDWGDYGDAGVLDGDDERGGVGVGAATAVEEIGVVIGDQAANDG